MTKQREAAQENLESRADALEGRSRPEVEEFKRLCASPLTHWGMADCDTVDLCDYILYLEKQMKLAAGQIRRAAMAPIHEKERSLVNLSGVADKLDRQAFGVRPNPFSSSCTKGEQKS